MYVESKRIQLSNGDQQNLKVYTYDTETNKV